MQNCKYLQSDVGSVYYKGAYITASTVCQLISDAIENKTSFLPELSPALKQYFPPSDFFIPIPDGIEFSDYASTVTLEPVTKTVQDGIVTGVTRNTTYGMKIFVEPQHDINKFSFSFETVDWLDSPDLTSFSHQIIDDYILLTGSGTVRVFAYYDDKPIRFRFNQYYTDNLLYLYNSYLFPEAEYESQIIYAPEDTLLNDSYLSVIMSGNYYSGKTITQVQGFKDNTVRKQKIETLNSLLISGKSRNVFSSFYGSNSFFTGDSNVQTWGYARYGQMSKVTTTSASILLLDGYGTPNEHYYVSNDFAVNDKVDVYWIQNGQISGIRKGMNVDSKVDITINVSGGTGTDIDTMMLYYGSTYLNNCTVVRQGVEMVRNTNFWGYDALNLTGVSPWNSEVTNTKRATLISPKHAITASHWSHSLKGHTIRFVSKDNTVYERVVVNKLVIPNTDVTVYELDSVLPTGAPTAVDKRIAYYKMFSSEAENYEPYDGLFTYSIIYGQSGVIIISGQTGYYSATRSQLPITNYEYNNFKVGGVVVQGNGAISATMYPSISNITTTLANWDAGASEGMWMVYWNPLLVSTVRHGDSGYPTFSLLNGEMVFGWNLGTTIIDQINAFMVNYQVELFDFSTSGFLSLQNESF